MNQRFELIEYIPYIKYDDLTEKVMDIGVKGYNILIVDSFPDCETGDIMVRVLITKPIN